MKFALGHMPSPMHYNHGMLLIERLCKDAGIDCELFEFGVEDKELPDCDILGFSSHMFRDYKYAKPLIDKALDKGKKVILGGTYHRRNNINEYDGSCLIARGEGEKIVDFLTSGDTTIFDTIYEHKDLNTLPLTECHGIMYYDSEISGFDASNMLPYHTSRGCHANCSFCEVKIQQRGVRIRTQVKDDLSYLTKKYEPKTVFICDEMMPYKSQAWRDSWKDFRYPFYGQIRADIDPEILEWLIDRGMVGCAFGVESGDEEFRNETLKKNLTDAQIYRTTDILKKHNIHFVPYYMYGAGETMKQAAETTKMMRKVGGVPYRFAFEKPAYNTKEN